MYTPLLKLDMCVYCSNSDFSYLSEVVPMCKSKMAEVILILCFWSSSNKIEFGMHVCTLEEISFS